MIGYWTRFARTGNPNGAGAPSWPSQHCGPDHVQALAPGAGGIGPVDLRAEHRYPFWRSLDR